VMLVVAPLPLNPTHFLLVVPHTGSPVVVKLCGEVADASEDIVPLGTLRPASNPCRPWLG
jgi:hypothetical protein